MSLKGVREELISSIKYNLSVVLENRIVQKVGIELEEAAGWFQSLGICNLLIYGDTDKLYENLIRSGYTRLYFLKRSREEQSLDDYQLAISRWESFFDCVAAGDFVLAQEIVSLSSQAWVKDGEYEDDFCYLFFLHNFVLMKKSRGILEDTMRQWEGWLDGKQSTRYNICKSFLEQDGMAFESNFQTLLENHTLQIEIEKKTTLAADITFAPRAQIFIEGIALLRLAKKLEFILEDDYPFCPELALASPKLPFPEDIFDEIETLRLSK